jgi:predicted RNA-binding Zn ribbon-like protein
MQQVRAQTTTLRGGTLCLDLANSHDWTESGETLGPENDALREPSELTAWGRRLSVLGRSSRTPGEDELEAVHALRLAVYAVFAAIAAEQQPPGEALELIAREHAEAIAAGRLAERDRAWRLRFPAGDPTSVRHAVADDAVRLLADPEALDRVRRCPGPRCGWLFLDHSGRRKWCSMDTCGSRAKMRALYARKRAAATR